MRLASPILQAQQMARSLANPVNVDSQSHDAGSELKIKTQLQQQPRQYVMSPSEIQCFHRFHSFIPCRKWNLLLETHKPQASRRILEVIGDLRSRIFMAPATNAKQRSCQMKATGWITLGQGGSTTLQNLLCQWWESLNASERAKNKNICPHR